ncbi:dynamin family protein [Myxococcota bacterium]|nr:dynamin family protein [Myxococcota bacterium]MBU1431062.1 dynamin family protein [Myxococcota bacterium]MBU1899796.1 dynamin family protein [Myxococcota bacterium]
MLEGAIGIWRKAVLPVAQKQRIELTSETELRAPPMVLFIGNHSSGKSSLINHLLGHNAQRTGVAPTDDGFTFLFYGEQNEQLDGEALSSNPEMPFSGLRRFGAGLLRHIRGVSVKAPILKRVWLIDSPGMIDAGAEAQRPYEFGKVVRHIAEQADLILLLFDPEKPGTTGETLQVLSQHLGGMEDRLRIVMNKMDLFADIRDFARAYGALCWNLSRTLRAQDLPHIYTTMIPGPDRAGLSPESFTTALDELREDINALPQRRADNRVTRMLHDGREVYMRAGVTEALRGKLHALLTRIAGATAGVGVLCGVGWMTTLNIVQPDARFGAHLLWSVTLLLLLTGAGLFGRKLYRDAQRHYQSDLDRIFEETFQELLMQPGRRADLIHAWSNARPEFERIFSVFGLRKLGRVRPAELQLLKEAIEVDLPEMRRDAPEP